ncbi:MAG: YceI family protein [Candidatus Rokubacteria bacterium]|nr:YceI family protein [Candidatus Rokubacteria bacterium]
MIEAASIDTASRRRDTHLRSEDFFWVERPPEVVFESVRVELGESAVVARGELVLDRKEYGLSDNSFFNPIEDTVRVAFRFRATRE